MTAPLLQVKDLLMQFQGLTALDRVSFDVAAGSITSLMGPNGAGKTSIISTLVTLEKPTAGRVEIFGFDVTEGIDLDANAMRQATGAFLRGANLPFAWSGDSCA